MSNIIWYRTINTEIQIFDIILYNRKYQFDAIVAVPASDKFTMQGTNMWHFTVHAYDMFILTFVDWW